jgi:hypothetical protein
MCRVPTLVFVLALASPAHAGDPASALVLDVHVSHTANLFHVVDQLSAWDPFTHAQYRESIALSDDDRRELARYAEVRRRHGWGGGLEQTFYVDDDLDAAIARGVADVRLTKDDASVVRRAIDRFAARIDALLEAERPRLDAFRKRIDERSGDLAAFAEKVSRFCGGRRVTVPVFLIANPSDDSMGGGYNGERLVIEIAHRTDAWPTFLHELMHAFLNPDLPRLEAAARTAEGLDASTLSEGLAYALAPGLHHGEGHDLDAEVARDLAEGRGLDDAYARFHRYALALRPLLGEALDDPHATLESFLPRAVDAWKVLRSIEAVKAPPVSFCAGPAWQALGKRVAPLRAFNHSEEHYRRIVQEARKGEMLVLLYALDHPDCGRPPGYDDLLPRPWPDVERELRAGRTVEATGAARSLHVVLLAAPTTAALEKLIAETHALSP